MANYTVSVNVEISDLPVKVVTLDFAIDGMRVDRVADQSPRPPSSLNLTEAPMQPHGRPYMKHLRA